MEVPTNTYGLAMIILQTYITLGTMRDNEGKYKGMLDFDHTISYTFDMKPDQRPAINNWY